MSVRSIVDPREPPSRPRSCGPFSEASRQSNKALLREKFGFDCGKHCTNQVVRDQEALAAAKVQKEKEARLISGSHDEAAVKQFLFEQGLVTGDMLVAPPGASKKRATAAHTCAVERFSTVEPGRCVPSEFIMEYLQGKLVPPLDLSLKIDPAPFMMPDADYVESYRFNAVASLAMWLRLQQLDKFSNRVQFLLFPTEVWDDRKLTLLQMYKAHIGKLGTDAAKELTGPEAAEMTRAHRLKLLQHIKFAKMIGYEVEYADDELNDSSSVAALLAAETGGSLGGDPLKGRELARVIQEELAKLPEGVSDAEKLRVIEAAEQEAALNPEFGNPKTVRGAVVHMLKSHHRKVVTGLGESLRGQASAQTHAYLILTFGMFSLPAVLLVVYVYNQLNAGKEKAQKEMIVKLQKRNTEADFYRGQAEAATKSLMAHQEAAIDPFGGRGGSEAEGGSAGAAAPPVPNMGAGGGPGVMAMGGSMPPMPAFRRGGAGFGAGKSQ